jgi:hypothetical protein
LYFLNLLRRNFLAWLFLVSWISVSSIGAAVMNCVSKDRQFSKNTDPNEEKIYVSVCDLTVNITDRDEQIKWDSDSSNYTAVTGKIYFLDQ